MDATAISAETLRDRDGVQFGFADDTGRSVALRLRSLTERSNAAGGAVLAEFVADAPHGLGQATYEVSADGLATTLLFAVPTSPTAMCVTFTWLAPEPGVA